MDLNEISLFCVTANVGSIFEEPEKLKKTWVDELLESISKCKPHFIAIHCQEVGGKSSEVSQNLVHTFVRDLYNHAELNQYTRCITFLDEDYSSKENFTALGCLYFVHNSLKDVRIWDFQKNEYLQMEETKELIAGSLDATPCIEKMKFPLNCFPKKIWSRKGYMITKWKIEEREMEFVNIHLIHDISNVKALQASPSKYAKYRKESLAYVLNRLGTKDGGHQLLFGDFNVRLDTKSFIEHFMKDASSYQVKRDGEKKPHSITYKDTQNQSEEMLHVEARRFFVKDDALFTQRRIQELLQFDSELKWTSNILKELPIAFLPTYPHSEDPSKPTIYSSTRCPAWCDRILMSSHLYNTINEFGSDVQYDLLGSDKCVGDHKPVLLKFKLKLTDFTNNNISSQLKSAD